MQKNPMIVKDCGEENGGMPDRRMRLILEGYLKSLGWQIETASGSRKPTDIVASSNSLKWIITFRAYEQTNPEPSEIFAAALGETLQRMECPAYKYSIAIPDTLPFRRLWRRLSSEAKKRTLISVLFVNSQGFISEEN